MVEKCKCGCSHPPYTTWPNLGNIVVCGTVMVTDNPKPKQERVIPQWIVEHDRLYPNCVTQMIKDGSWDCCGHVTHFNVTYDERNNVGNMRLPFEPKTISFEDRVVGYLIRESGVGYVWTS